MPTGLLALGLACVQNPIDDTSVEVSFADIQTVVTVAFTAPDVDSVAIEYGKTTDYGMRTPEYDSAGPDHSVTLLGLAVETEYHYRLVVTVGNKEFVGGDHSIVTGGPESDLREVSVALADTTSIGDDFVMTTVSDAMPPADIVILNREGEYVWYHEITDGVSYKAIRVPGSTDLMWMVDNQADFSNHRVERMSLDGTLVSSVETSWSHHDFCLVPGIQFAFLQADPQEWGGEIVVGDNVVEVLEDGSQVTAWSSFDTMTPVPGASGWDYNFYPEGHDWTHANSLVYDEADNAYYVSLYWMRQILKIDRATGEILWRLGGEESDFDITGQEFGPQHGLNIVDGDLLFFDNLNGLDGGSRLVRYALDEDNWTATLAWSFSPSGGIHAITQGDVVVQSTGALLSSWGDAGTILELSPDDEVTWQLETERPTEVSHVETTPSLYE